METRSRILHWFVKKGTLVTPDGLSIEVSVEPVTIGRDASATIVLDDPEVSAMHAELRAGPHGVELRDLGSKNGTFVGDLRIDTATLMGPLEIRVGEARLAFKPSDKSRVDVGFDESFGPLVGGAPKMRRLYQTLAAVAKTELGVLVLGETGTGKELVAQAIHEASPRAKGPLVVIDCGAIPPTLAESILFGHEKGAFTGADRRKEGALAEAKGGTVFLDELGELPEEVQPKLLRAIAEKSIKRVGGSQYEPYDARIVAATRRDLRREMNAGHFRSDLYFRVAQVRVELPPLRERKEDIPAVVARVCARLKKPDRAEFVAAQIDRRLAHHDWPGNVRELVNVASVLAEIGDATVLDSLELVLPTEGHSLDGPASTPAATQFAEAKRRVVTQFERAYFSDLLARAQGNVSEMARQSGMERHHVRAFLRKLGLSSV